MKPLPETEETLLLRADFTDDAAWESVCAAVREPVGEFQAYVECISDPAFDGVTPEQLPGLAGEDSARTFACIVDAETITNDEHPVLVVDLFEEPGRTFRVIPAEMWGVENNLSICNMDFADFADHTDDDGVFRGFPEM